MFTRSGTGEPSWTGACLLACGGPLCRPTAMLLVWSTCSFIGYHPPDAPTKIEDCEPVAPHADAIATALAGAIAVYGIYRANHTCDGHEGSPCEGGQNDAVLLAYFVVLPSTVLAVAAGTSSLYGFVRRGTCRRGSRTAARTCVRGTSTRPCFDAAQPSQRRRLLPRAPATAHRAWSSLPAPGGTSIPRSMLASQLAGESNPVRPVSQSMLVAGKQRASSPSRRSAVRLTPRFQGGSRPASP